MGDLGVLKAQLDLYEQGFVTLNPVTDACYFLDPREYNRSVTLRVETSKNNQSKSVRLAADFRRVP